MNTNSVLVWDGVMIEQALRRTNRRVRGHWAGWRFRPRLTLGAALLLGLALSGAGAPTPALAAAPTPEEGEAFFEKNIRPLLIQRCYECHSLEAKKTKGGLSLDSKQGMLKGGDLGPAVEPGKPDDSLLIQAVRYQEDDLKMPPKGKLSANEIALLSQWVAMGAPDPRLETTPAPAKQAFDIESRRSFWAFQPPENPAPPPVRDSDWAKATIDRFILAPLEAKGLKPAPATSKRALIRRATFDLTGLPPRPRDIDAFLADESADAFAKVVDRLLASPQYGERWGRHWLDVARYADSNGLDENVAYGNSWRYRDYVVEAFNQDKPFDQFIQEQLAGDLLPAAPNLPEKTRHERLIATGFLALGPKVLAEPDKSKLEMDIVDEQVDTVGRAFMGLTLGCARCHDHKFDPIATTDYYALAGVFRSTKTMETFKTVARWNENSLADKADLARKAEHDAKVVEQKKVIGEVLTRANDALKAKSKPGFVLPAKPEPLYPAETQAELKKLRDELAKLEKAAPEMPSAMGVTEGKVEDVAVHIRGSHLSLGEKVHRRAPQVLTTSANAPTFTDQQSGRLELARWLTRPDHPLTSRVMVNRIWRWHFGRGLVATTDNFGLLGDRPTNAPLLDWLACRFVESGWSLKELHRTIMVSSTYQMSSDYDAKAAAADPENVLQWRFSPRRLEVEAIRDALLSVSGLLDARIGGSLLKVKNHAYFFDHTSKDATDYKTQRRSLYLPVVRNNMYDVFDLFDYADASVMTSNRGTTTVAPQALFMMNSEMIAKAARGLATSILEQNRQDPERIRDLYVRCVSRVPEQAEVDRARTFLDQYGRTLAKDQPKTEARERSILTWQALCQALLASNEFVYLD